METAQLYNGLTFLSYATGIIVILVGVMLAKVLFDVLEPFDYYTNRNIIDEKLSIFFSDDPHTYNFVYTIEKPLT